MKCPLIRKECMGDKCAWWAESVTIHPETKAKAIMRTCVVNIVPDMVMNLIKNTAGGKRATEEVRNRMEHVVKNGRMQNEMFVALAENSQRKNLADPTRE